MKTKQQGIKQGGFIGVCFLILCISCLLSLWSWLPVTDCAFSDTETIRCTFLMSPGAEACTRGQGYWRHHPDVWPVEELTVGGIVYTTQEALAVMNTPGAGDKTYDLFRQLAATMLNLFNGCNPECISETVMLADDWLVCYPVGSGVRACDPAWKTVQPWFVRLGQYNSGLLCEQACDCPLEVLFDASPQTLTRNTSYTFQVLMIAEMEIEELRVQYWFNETVSEELAFSAHAQVWEATLIPPTNASCFWYRLSWRGCTEDWVQGETQEVIITDEGGDDS